MTTPFGIPVDTFGYGRHTQAEIAAAWLETPRPRNELASSNDNDRQAIGVARIAETMAYGSCDARTDAQRTRTRRRTSRNCKSHLAGVRRRPL